MRYSFLAFLGTLVILSAAPAMPTSKMTSEDPSYFPTQTGFKWVYDEQGKEKTYVITEVADKDGAKVVSVGRKEGGRVTPYQKVKVFPAGIAEVSFHGRPHDSPLSILKLPLKKGVEFEVDTRGPGNCPMKWKRTVWGPGKVVVPAGTFLAVAVEDAYTMPGVDGLPDAVLIRTKWYAPEIGLVKETSAERAVPAVPGASHEKTVQVLKSFSRPKR